jgi:hypothetical protein
MERHIVSGLALVGLGVALQGCTDCDVPDLSGEPVVIAVFERVWGEFSDSTTRFGTCVSSISQVTNPEMGRYFPIGRRVTISPEVDASDLYETVHHELCHALDVQNNLSEGMGESLGFVSPTTRRERREAFAGVCEHGEYALDLMHQPECVVTPGTVAVDAVRREAFRSRAFNPPAALVWAARYQNTDLEGASLISVVGRDNGIVEFRWGSRGNTSSVVVDGLTGEPTQSIGFALPRLDGQILGPDAVVIGETWQWPDDSGDTLAIGSVSVSVGELTRVLLTFPDSSGVLWVPVSGCVGPGATIFQLGEALWVAHIVGDAIEWGQVVRWRDPEWPTLQESPDFD